MQKYIQITEKVRLVAIFNPEKTEGSKYMIQLDVVKPGAKQVFYVIMHEDDLDDIEIEPGQYVTLLHHVDNVIERGEGLFIKVSDIYINEEETEKKRNQFDFEEFEDDELGVIHKVLIESPYHVSDNNFTFNK